MIEVMFYSTEKTFGFCERPLGMESGQIRDNQLSCHSFYWPDHSQHAGPTQARLNTGATSLSYDSWVPYSKTSSGHWFMVSIHRHRI